MPNEIFARFFKDTLYEEEVEEMAIVVEEEEEEEQEEEETWRSRYSYIRHCVHNDIF